MTLLSCENLCIGYKNKQLIENLTFCVDEGFFLCVLGDNGSGKSTLMKTILGLKKPISGKICYGEELKKGKIGYSEEPKKDKIGYGEELKKGKICYGEKLKKGKIGYSEEPKKDKIGYDEELKKGEICYGEKLKKGEICYGEKLKKGKIGYSEEPKKDKIGYLPQQTPAQKDFPATAFEIVLSGTIGSCTFLPIYTKKQKNAARESMAKLGISDLEKRCYRELSGGQQQRVLLARALCASRKLIVLDEPVASLDPDAAEKMYLAINDLYKSGIAVIMVSHDAKAAIKYATHVLYIAKRPKFFGNVEEFLMSDLAKQLKLSGSKKPISKRESEIFKAEGGLQNG